MGVVTQKTSIKNQKFSIFDKKSVYIKDPEEDSYNLAAFQQDNKLTLCCHGAHTDGRSATDEVARLYKVHDYLLGAGAFGRVYLAESKMNSNAKYAIKIIPLKNIGEAVKDQMREELCILNKLDHPYVAKYEQAFEDQNYIYIVMTHITGQVLENELEEVGRYSEVEAAHLFWKILLGVKHMHSCNVIHRDLKPENIMVDENQEPIIIDFGLSKDSSDPYLKLTSFVGSKIYMAPEIISGETHSFPCDMWSMGVILYLMLSGQYPFNFRRLEDDIKNTPVLFIGPTWENISVEAKHLIGQLLQKDQYTRITAKEALDHSWFKIQLPKRIEQGSQGQIQLDNEIVGQLLNYRGMSKVRMIALRILVTMMNKKEVEPLRKLFLEIDKDRTGFITSLELQEAMEKSNYNFTKQEINDILQEVDLRQNGKINYTEFIAATLCVEKYMTDEKLREIFMHFDVDDTGYICRNNIRESMVKMGQELSDQEIEEALGTHDVTGDSRIAFEEFKHMFVPNDQWLNESDEMTKRIDQMQRQLSEVANPKLATK